MQSDCAIQTGGRFDVARPFDIHAHSGRVHHAERAQHDARRIAGLRINDHRVTRIRNARERDYRVVVPSGAVVVEIADQKLAGGRGEWRWIESTADARSRAGRPREGRRERGSGAVYAGHAGAGRTEHVHPVCLPVITRARDFSGCQRIARRLGEVHADGIYERRERRHVVRIRACRALGSIAEAVAVCISNERVCERRSVEFGKVRIAIAIGIGEQRIRSHSCFYAVAQSIAVGVGENQRGSRCKFLRIGAPVAIGIRCAALRGDIAKERNLETVRQTIAVRVDCGIRRDDLDSRDARPAVARERAAHDLDTRLCEVAENNRIARERGRRRRAGLIDKHKRAVEIVAESAVQRAEI